MKFNEKEISQIESKIKETVDKLNKIYKFNMSYPLYYFDIKGTTAGIAKSISMSIHLNPVLAKKNWSDFINITIPHEICHLGVFQLVKTEGRMKYPPAHGATWKMMMFEVGSSSKATHNFDVTDVRRKIKKYEYDCNCDKKITVSATIHNKIKKGARYACKKCNTILKDGIMIRQLKFSNEIEEK